MNIIGNGTGELHSPFWEILDWIIEKISAIYRKIRGIQVEKKPPDPELMKFLKEKGFTFEDEE